MTQPPEGKPGPRSVPALSQDINEYENMELEMSELPPLDPSEARLPVPSWAAGRALPRAKSDVVSGAASPIRPPIPRPTRLGWIGREKGVLGYTVSERDGTITESSGRGSAVFSEQCAYFLELAQIVGEELGLEDLREMRVVGRQSKLLVKRTADAGRVAVLADKQTDLAPIAKKLETT